MSRQRLQKTLASYRHDTQMPAIPWLAWLSEFCDGSGVQDAYELLEARAQEFLAGLRANAGNSGRAWARQMKLVRAAVEDGLDAVDELSWVPDECSFAPAACTAGPGAEVMRRSRAARLPW